MSKKSPYLSRRAFLTAAAGQAALLAGCRGGALSFGDPLRAATAETPSRRLFIQTSRPRQTMDHFGASACWSLDPIGRAFTEAEREQIATLLFSRDKGIGLSLLRFNLGAGDPKPEGYSNSWRRVECFQDAPGAPVDGTRQPGQQWFLKAAKRHGVEKTLAFINSPPAWLTKNGRGFGDDSVGTTNLRDGAERAFGEYIADVLLDFEKRGLPFDYISPINEPNWDWNGGQEGCRYGNEDMQRVLLVLSRTLRARGVRAELCALEAGDLTSLLDDADFQAYRGITRPEANATGGRLVPGKRRNYLHDLLGDPGVKEALGPRILAHSYWTVDSWHDRHDLRVALRQNLDRYAPGGAYWQSEYCFMEHKRDLSMDTALRLAGIIHADLTAAEAAAWSWWLAVSPADYKDGLIYTDYGPGGGAHTVLPSKMLWTLGNWSRFVRPGAHRVELATDAFPLEMLASAFVDAAGKRLTVVVVNPGSESRTIRMDADRTLGAITPYVTDATHDLAAGGIIPAGTPVTLPARSVVTLVADLGAASSADAAQIPAALPQRERAGGSDLYVVRCGAGGDMLASADARRNALADMAYGVDPGTGYHWGYTSYGNTGGRDDGASGRSARWDDGDTAGQGLTYRFEVPPKRPIVVEIGFWDPWNNGSRRMDVLLQGTKVESDLVPGAEAITRHYALAAPDDGTLEIAVRRTADNAKPDTDPLISSIRIRPA